ncbi:MAG: ATPase [Blastocatellia bacterium]|nr:ATPase [Blastocatellia bacterium]
MRSTQRMTNRNFTKPVDHDGGRHREPKSLPDHTRCETCGSVYSGRHWAAPALPERVEFQLNPNSFHLTLCPACQQQKEGIAGGFVHLEGTFLEQHREEIVRLLQKEAKRAYRQNRLARILEWKDESNGKVFLSTTTEHLAQRLGHALEKAFKGQVRYDFSLENKLAHVWWTRD